MSHWYSKTGDACHTYTDASGAEKPTGLREARKWGLLPSASGVVHVWANKGLERARERKLIATARITPYSEWGGTESFISEVMKAALADWELASSTGTVFHGLIESKLTKGEHSKTPIEWGGKMLDPEPLVDAALKVVSDIHILDVEKRVVRLKDGYAGTTDLPYARENGHILGVADWKTTKTTEKKKMAPKQGHVAQIAAYWMAYHGLHLDEIPSHAEGRNIYISTTEPGRIETLVYDHKELRKGWAAFKACLELWRQSNSYDPRGS